jgi:GPH family glycoside/pentoside/hexuronide:cation symporter
MVFSVIGYIAGAGVSGVLADVYSKAFGVTVAQGWSLVALTFGVLGGISMLIPGLFLKYEPAVESKPSELPPFKSIISTFKNKPFVMYVIITSIMSISFTMVTTMLNYYIAHQVHMEESGLLVMLAMMGTLAVFLVPCGILSGKIGKANTYALGLSIASAALIGVFLLPKGPTPLVFILAAIAGLGFSAQWVCPHSMIPDVIEYDELMTGERREGVYYGVHATSGKITGALASAACGWGLELGGYIDNLEQASAGQPDGAVLAIRIMFALVPAVFLLICVPLLLKYPITKESHAEVMKQLQERRAAKESAEAKTK